MRVVSEQWLNLQARLDHKREHAKPDDEVLGCAAEAREEVIGCKGSRVAATHRSEEEETD